MKEIKKIIKNRDTYYVSKLKIVKIFQFSPYRSIDTKQFQSKFPGGHFVHIKLMLKFIWEGKGTIVIKENYEKGNSCKTYTARF